MKFLTISLDDLYQVDIENLNRLTFDGNVDITKVYENGEIGLELELGPRNEDGFETYMTELRFFNETQHEHFFEMFTHLKRNQTGPVRFQPLLSPTWIERHHGDFSSGSSILGRIRPGVFQTQYGPHGLEMVHFKDGQGVKITGDPNVPFNQITFRVTNRDRVDFPPEIQSDYGLLRDASEDFKQFCVEDSQDLKFKIQLPSPGEGQYLGRWIAEGHIADDGFTNDSFVPANFILFDEDEFAVSILLWSGHVRVFKRIEI